MKTIITIVLLLLCAYFLLSAFPETRGMFSTGNSGSNAREFINEETSYMDIILGACSVVALIVNISRKPKK